MADCNTAVSPLLAHWRCHRIPQSCTKPSISGQKNTNHICQLTPPLAPPLDGRDGGRAPPELLGDPPRPLAPIEDSESHRSSSSRTKRSIWSRFAWSVQSAWRKRNNSWKLQTGNINCSVTDCGKSSALAMELLLKHQYNHNNLYLYQFSNKTCCWQ